VGQFIFWPSLMPIMSVFTDPQIWKVVLFQTNKDLAGDL
jgi:hypothetical protein